MTVEGEGLRVEGREDFEPDELGISARKTLGQLPLHVPDFRAKVKMNT